MRPLGGNYSPLSRPVEVSPGTETTGAINDFLRETARFYPAIKEEMIRIVLVHGGGTSIT